MRRIRKRASVRAFSLIEVLVVLVIIGSIVGAIGWNVFRQKLQADIRTARIDIQMLRQAVTSHRLMHNKLPDALTELVPNEVERIRKDPWGTPYAYSRSGETFEIRSYGPDHAQGGDDDVLPDEDS